MREEGSRGGRREKREENGQSKNTQTFHQN